jgi:hypothetical protein
VSVGSAGGIKPVAYCWVWFFRTTTTHSHAGRQASKQQAYIHLACYFLYFHP